MARQVELGQCAIIVHLTGLTSMAALKRRLEIPYTHIAQVSIGAPDLNSLIRLGGAALGEAQEGHFWHGEDWYFLSYEHPNEVIRLTLNGYHIGGRVYKVIAVGVDDPEYMKEKIDERLRREK